MLKEQKKSKQFYEFQSTWAKWVCVQSTKCGNLWSGGEQINIEHRAGIENGFEDICTPQSPPLKHLWVEQHTP